MTRRETVENIISDLVGSFMYYDRKEDEDLPNGHIETAIDNKEITVCVMVPMKEIFLIMMLLSLWAR